MREVIETIVITIGMLVTGFCLGFGYAVEVMK